MRQDLVTRERQVWEDALLIFMKKVMCFELEFETVKNGQLGEEHSWTATIEGNEVFQWEEENKKEEPRKEGGKRKNM